jgi:hypothetical protein
MKVSDVLVGAGFLVGAAIGLAGFVVRTTVNFGMKAVSDLPKSLADLPLQVHPFDHSKHKRSANSAAKTQSTAKAQNNERKGKAENQPPSPGLSPDTAQQLADTLSTKPSIDKEEEKHPYSATLKNPGGFRPSGAGGNAV